MADAQIIKIDPKKKKGLSLPKNPPKIIGRLFKRYHMTLFIIFIVGCLAAAVLFLTNILNDASLGAGYESPISAGSIDQATLDRINALHTSDDPLPAALSPAGRPSPFSE